MDPVQNIWGNFWKNGHIHDRVYILKKYVHSLEPGDDSILPHLARWIAEDPS